MARIALIATGGIRAPTQIALAERFQALGHEVRCLATRSALRFLAPHLIRRPRTFLRYARLYRTALRHRLAYLSEPRLAPHVEEAAWADVIVVAPATCNTIGKLAAGITDSLALLVIRAAGRDTPVIVVPSMNTEMWFDPLFQRSVDLLNGTEKYHVLSPAEGEMLTGPVGWGAQVSLDTIVAATQHAVGQVDHEVERFLGGGAGACVVLVDEDEQLRREIVSALARDLPAVRVEQFAHASEALDWVRAHPVSVVVTELTFSSGVDGIALIDHFRRLGSRAGVHLIAISARTRAEADAEELSRRDVHFQSKPLNVEFLVGVICGCIHRPHAGLPARTVRLAPGEVLFHEGERGTHLYLVDSGRLNVLRSVGGRDIAVGTLGPGAVVGELAFFGHGIRSATVRADEPAVVAEVDLDDVRDYLRTQPVWLRELIRSVTGHLHRLEETALAAAARD